MTKKFRSVRRQLKRGNLKLTFIEKIVGWDTSHVTGGVTPIIREVPQLMRKTNSGRLVHYN